MSVINDVVLVDGSRTPIASFGKSLRSERADTLAKHVISNAVRRARIDFEQVDAVILGQAYQTSQIPNLARDALLKAGGSRATRGHTLHMQCASGMKAVNTAMDEIKLGHGNVIIAGGVESMSTIPYLVDGELRFEGKRAQPFVKFATEFDKSFAAKVVDWISRKYDSGFFATRLNRTFANMSKYGPRPFIGMVDDGLLPTHLLWDTKTTHMSGTAQLVADIYAIKRSEMDEFALRSHQLANAARESGRFDVEIDPIMTRKGEFARDEHPRKDTSLTALAKMRGANKTRDITAGNASGINDGGCALVLTSATYAAEHGMKPLARLVDHVSAGLDYETMGLGPVVAINKLLERNKLTVADVDLFEINEAFAAQYLGCEKLLGLNRDKVNVNGGAIALGHPIAMSGARVIFTLAHELKLRGLKRGIASLCVGGGMGIATLIENPDVA